MTGVEATRERCRCHVFFSDGRQECETCGATAGLAARSGPNLQAPTSRPEPQLTKDRASAGPTPQSLDLEDELDDDAGR